eukprot:CAMPEP_0201679586 /NCGR_PEP_ID=MMETSP0494-20130426/48826_1 /ASSEMBLY_ACC=CAM_ASM_000839 /TAXON_ID=420259 /ORGANISM="Thalassiosira gravida, Strain GMp14c1" /LENGTH=54 /DNA_ID=CAMNT_0048163113 /DNA_START=27 /DNA_END=191 /DNA_ORIENTATION=-
MTRHGEHGTTTLICGIKDDEYLILVNEPSHEEENRSHGQNGWRYAGVDETDDDD